MVSASPALTFRKSWDKTMVPLPFSRVTVIFHESWNINHHNKGKCLEQVRQDVEATLSPMRVLADLDTGYAGG